MSHCDYNIDCRGIKNAGCRPLAVENVLIHTKRMNLFSSVKDPLRKWDESRKGIRMIIRKKNLTTCAAMKPPSQAALVFETGKLAELCNASVLAKYGETTVMVTSPLPQGPATARTFPLSVDFEEKLYAVGRIPGSYMRRESRPSLPAVLAAA